MSKREQVTVYFVKDDPADMEIWNWLGQKTTNKNAYIKKILFHHMQNESKPINVTINTTEPEEK